MVIDLKKKNVIEININNSATHFVRIYFSTINFFCVDKFLIKHSFTEFCK